MTLCMFMHTHLNLPSSARVDVGRSEKAKPCNWCSTIYVQCRLRSCETSFQGIDVVTWVSQCRFVFGSVYNQTFTSMLSTCRRYFQGFTISEVAICENLPTLIAQQHTSLALLATTDVKVLVLAVTLPTIFPH